MTETTKNTLKKQSAKYLMKQIFDPEAEWFNVPGEQKLSFVQYTPKSIIKKRTVGKAGGKTIEAEYLPIRYVKRCLNFISNFQRGYEITDKEMIETMTSKGKSMYQAYIQMRCRVKLSGSDFKITQEVIGTWKTYGNPAVSKFEVYKSAESNGIKRFAENLGIGMDKGDAYNDSISKVRQSLQSESRSEEADDQVIGNFTGGQTDNG